LIATIIGVPILIAADADHVGARGAILATTVSHDRNHTTSSATERTFVPDITLRTHYDDQYKWFRTAYPALKPIFAGLGKSG
jgi:sugar (pentulose or hexulose) kinase